MLRRFRALVSIASLVALALLARQGPAAPAENDARGIELFETKIRPILVAQCYECHSAQASKVKAGLYLDTRDGLRKGGDSGPAVVPGNPAQSLLIKALRHEKLKMPKTKLPDAVIADFEQWVRIGAPDPRGGKASTVPRITLADARSWWSFKPVQKPITPHVADNGWARTDIDRFVIAGLQAHNLKPMADADRATLVRRVYFDLIGLPPTPDEVDTALRDKSSQWCETVVDRLLASSRFGERWGRYWLDIARYAESNGNADNTPFPEAWRYRDYVIAALAQDKPYDQFIREQIAGDLLPAKDAKQKDEQLVATGFLALTSKPRAQNNPDYRFDLIADQIDVTTRGVLGLSVMCARCHDHKFDPVPTKEYYALAGIFDSTKMLFGSAAAKGAKKNGGGGGLHSLSDSSGAMGVGEGKVTDVRVCIRGESKNLGDTVPRGFLSVASISTPPVIERKHSGRLELAQWLTSRDNPLTARVAVNRVWLHLFGQGLVRSPDNFGALGEKPSHPELLDYLALQFMDNGWSTKKLVRAIVLSRTYQLSSHYDADSYKTDPDNRWLWRMHQRRLDAEATRDAMLAVSGRLDLTPPAGSLAVLAKGKAAQKKGVNGAQPESRHRSVYLGIVRGAPLAESLAVFDVANPNLVVAQRDVTTVPAQALYLMNSPFVVEQSQATAERLLTLEPLDDAGRVEQAYRLMLGRSATDAERRRTLAFVNQMMQDLGAKDKNAPRTAWASFCQAVFASAEFRYLR